MCKGITKKGNRCLKGDKYDGYCHIHRIVKVEEELRINIKTVEKTANLKEDIFHKNKSLERKNKEIKKLKERIRNISLENIKYQMENKLLSSKIEDLKDEHAEKVIKIDYLKEEVADRDCQINDANDIIIDLEEDAQNYRKILEFESFKCQIKNIFNWKAPFYIEDIKKEKKYHKVLEETFGMSINEIINTYYKKKRIRNALAHKELY